MTAHDVFLLFDAHTQRVLPGVSTTERAKLCGVVRQNWSGFKTGRRPVTWAQIVDCLAQWHVAHPEAPFMVQIGASVQVVA